MTVKELIEALKPYGDAAKVWIAVELDMDGEKQYRESRAVEVQPAPCVDAVNVEIMVRLEIDPDHFWGIKEVSHD